MTNNDCAFCQGEQAYHDGQQLTANPYPPPPPDVDETLQRYEHPHVLWAIGWRIGGHDHG